MVIDRFIKNKNVDFSHYIKDIYVRTIEVIDKDYKQLTFGNHTQNHYVLSSLTKDEQYQEISKGEIFLKGLDLPRSKIFSIPFGGNNDFNNQTLEIVKDLGYLGFVRSNGGCLISHNEIEGRKNRKLIDLNRFMPNEINFFHQLI